jgi:hypothetical protein
MSLRNRIELITAVFLLALVAACASAPSPPSENLLTSAGFKTLTATTPIQKQHLQSLPQAQLTQMQQNGKHYYVYPDVAGGRLFVGTPKEYQAYLALRTQNGLANPGPSNQAAANEAQYARQDAAMVKADNQDATIPSWAFWPEFGGLGWIP